MGREIITESDKFLAEESSRHRDEFGTAVSLDGDTVLISATEDDEGSSDAGAAYIFLRDPDGSWSQVKKLIAHDANRDDNFGSSVSLDGETALIGANNAKSRPASGSTLDDGRAGAAYTFERDSDGIWKETAKFFPENGIARDSFGESVSLDGNIALVGNPDSLNDPKDSASVRTGAVFVFEKGADDKWIETGMLLAGDGSSRDRFGMTVSLNVDTALIGATGNNDSTGAVYVFVRSSDGKWTESTKLLPSDGSNFDNFGRAVSLNMNTALIASNSKNENGVSTGAVYVFMRNSDGKWTESTKLLPSDGSKFQSFGSHVSLSGDTALIGASGDDDKGSDVGAAYIFVRNADDSWTETAKLLPSDAMDGSDSRFGWSVSLDNGTALIGFPHDSNSGNIFDGSVYVFDELNQIPDEIAPIIIVLPAELQLSVASSEPNLLMGITATDNLDGDISSQVTATGTVDVMNIGDYVITYNVIDNAGNSAIPQTRTYHVVDDILPVITISPLEIILSLDSSLPNLLDGVTATDNLDGNISSQTTATGTVDVKNIGDYVITYNVTDNAGNNATPQTRTYHVVDNIAPEITVIPIEVTLESDSLLPDLLTGVSAIDNIDGDISPQITTTGTVDILTPGDYIIMYNVQDSAGNNATPRSRIYTVIASDRDNDGMPDIWEDQFGDLQPASDDDGDGIPNIVEFQEALDPTSSDDDLDILILYTGWNLLSIPSGYYENQGISEFFDGKIIGPVWTWNSSFKRLENVANDNLSATKGYWIFSLEITGIRLE